MGRLHGQGPWPLGGGGYADAPSALAALVRPTHARCAGGISARLGVRHGCGRERCGEGCRAAGPAAMRVLIRREAAGNGAEQQGPRCWPPTRRKQLPRALGHVAGAAPQLQPAQPLELLRAAVLSPQDCRRVGRRQRRRQRGVCDVEPRAGQPPAAVRLPHILLQHPAGF
jgi:hypothetical protein